MKITINRKAIVLYFELFLAMAFACLTHYSLISDVVKFFEIVAVFLELLVFLHSLRNRGAINRCFSATEVILVFFIIYQWIITVVNQSLPMLGSLSFPCSVALCLLALLRNKERFEMVLKVLLIFFWTACLANLLSIFFFPNGMYTEYSSSGNFHIGYFIGIANQFGSFLFPGFAIIFFSEVVLKRKTLFFSATTLVMMLIAYIKAGSSTGLITTVVLVILYVLYKFKLFDKILPLKSFAIIMITFSVLLLTGAALIYNNSYISNTVMNITGKNMTFSSRTYIWTAGISKFEQNPLWGYGKTSSSVSVVYRGRNYSAHNIILQLLLEAGIAGLGIFLAYLFKAGERTSRFVKQHREIRILYIGLFTTFIYFMMEVSDLIPLIVMIEIMSIYAEIITENSAEFSGDLKINKKNI